MGNERTILLAHPKGWGEEQVNEAKAIIRNATGASVVTGREDYDKHFAEDGGWSGWSRSVFGRRDEMGRFVYAGAALCGDEDEHGVIIGKATAQMVEAAPPGFPLFVIQGGRVAVARPLDCIDPKNFKAGWRANADE